VTFAKPEVNEMYFVLLFLTLTLTMNPEARFFDAPSKPPDLHLSYLDALHEPDKDQEPDSWDPSDDTSERSHFGWVFHLSLAPDDHFLREPGKFIPQ
jgi:hypothetical protein